MVCKVFFAKKLSEKGRKSGNKLSGMLFADAVPCKCRKAQKKADFSQHFRGSRKVQTFRIKNAVSGCRFTPGKAFARAALRAEEAPHPSPLQG